PHSPSTTSCPPTPPPPTSTLFPYTTLFRSHPNEIVREQYVGQLAVRCDLPAETLARALARGPRRGSGGGAHVEQAREPRRSAVGDRKSTRLNSSHVSISYAVFCLKKKTVPPQRTPVSALFRACSLLSLCPFSTSSPPPQILRP